MGVSVADDVFMTHHHIPYLVLYYSPFFNLIVLFKGLEMCDSLYSCNYIRDDEFSLTFDIFWFSILNISGRDNIVQISLVYTMLHTYSPEFQSMTLIKGKKTV